MVGPGAEDSYPNAGGDYNPYDPYSRPDAQQALNMGIGAGQGLTMQDAMMTMPQQSMAEGGLVTTPTVARIGERGPEAVVKICPRMNYQRR
jgi:hypothetical protein